MICFPHAKINIGLRIIEKRSDGFHNLETIFYPITDLYDSLEIVKSKEFKFDSSGILIDGDSGNNLCVKAYNILKEKYNITPVHIHLQKNIPFGAGLGGGSADAAFTLKMLNEIFELNLSTKTLEELALQLGSDCPFFIESKPVFAEAQGEKFSPILLNLSEYWIVLVNPNIHVSTAEAYGGVKPYKSNKKLNEIFPTNIKEWKGVIVNDFEKTVFKNHPKIAELKQTLYDLGANYSTMSGSGSTVFGIFKNKPQIPEYIPTIFVGKLS